MPQYNKAANPKHQEEEETTYLKSVKKMNLKRIIN